MVIFKLSMPNIGSWNGKWTGEEKIYARCKKNVEVPKEIIGNSFSYDFGDGWSANVKVEKVDSKLAVKIMSKSSGFYGYDWMIDSIIKNKEIKLEK